MKINAYTIKNNTVKDGSTETLQSLFENSACTMLGYRPEELHLYTEELHSKGFLKDNFTVYTTTGKEINSVFNLNDPLPEDLNVFIISLDDMLDIGKFAVGLRFERGYRWLDDIVYNKRRQNA